ncbi:MAG: ion channel [Desulfobacteraceae bacterium]|nr:ion channel [Desulfobacteraceae bacterium]
MIKRKFHDFRQAFSTAPFFILLILILLMMILPPFLDDWVSTRILLDVLLTAILFALIFAIRSNHSEMIIGVILALPLILTMWASYFILITGLGLAAQIFAALFFGYAAVNILRRMFKQQEVTRETIFSAIVAYLLIALMWAYVYMLLETLVPGSFAFPDTDLRTTAMHFKYFSFVTITTLGYGDILPVTNKASSLAMLEALVGQIYLVVLVAWLVGMHVSRKSK